MTKPWMKALTIRNLVGATLVALFAAAPALAQAPTLRMLDTFDAGLWEVRVRDGNRMIRQLCLETGRPLVQIKHPNALCRSFVVKDENRLVIVHYTCPGAGYGRTQIRLENPQLAQVESQGIVDGFPFDFSAEVRRVGVCRG